MYKTHFQIITAHQGVRSSFIDIPTLRSATKIVAIVLLCAAGAIPPALAEELIVRSMSEIESGTLLFDTAGRDHYIRAPLVDTSVNIGVQGLLARTIVRQTFTNESSDWVEGVYVFPLPDDATVDELTMIIGDTRIDGVIQTRKKAKRTYQTAKRTGKKATLLEQQRANLFTARVANIPPGESISIDIVYQSTIRYSDGQFSMVFPLTITPRYLSARHLPRTALQYTDSDLIAQQDSAWAIPATQVTDASEITPPVTDTPAPVSIEVTLDTGLPGLSISSSTHDIISTLDSNTSQQLWNVSLASGSVPADRDFKLTWTPQVTTAPVAAIFRQDKQSQKSTESFASLMLMPPQQIFNDSIIRREVIFVIDTSQSMSGTSIAQARKTLALGIERLSSQDTFNVIEFDNDTNKLFSNSVTADDANKNTAINWVQQLTADGGTEILAAMASALNGSSPEDRLRQVVFVTDGSVGNEQQIFRYLKQTIGTTRLFTIGIGSAPNIWFMRKSAELGKGTYTHIANASEIVDKTLLLLAKLERPALTDVKIRFNTASTPEVYPAIIPDVYMGEPVLADARWSDKLKEGDIEVTGTYAGQQWTQKIKLGSLSNQTTARHNTQGLDKLWAFRKIQSLEDKLLQDANPLEVEKDVTDIALSYSLVTKYTSLVAVEDGISRDPSASSLKPTSLPQSIPAGNTMQYPQGSLGTTIRFLISLVLALLAVLIVLPKLRQPDTSIVCTALRTGSRKCKSY